MNSYKFLHRRACNFSSILNNNNQWISKRFNTTYGFIGLGQMGSRMVNNLITKTKSSNSTVLVYDTYKPSLESAINNGAIETEPSEMGDKCDYIITMLASDKQVNDVYNDILSKPLKNNILLIDSSTINHLTTQNLAKLVESKQGAIIDAPVSGGIGAAEAGTLTFMVGGKEELYNKSKNVLNYMGTQIFHAGNDDGSGQIAKICNNLILGISMDAVSEGINLGVKLGMDPQKLSNIVNKSSGRCWSSDQYNPCPSVVLQDDKGNDKSLPSQNNYNGGFKVDLMRKDLNLALNAAKGCDANTPLGSLVSQMYDMIYTRNYGNKDFGFIYQFIKGDETNGIDKDKNDKRYCA